MKRDLLISELKGDNFIINNYITDYYNYGSVIIVGFLLLFCDSCHFVVL